MSYIEKEKLIKADIASIENRVRHAFNQGYDLGYKEGKANCSEIPTGSTTKREFEEIVVEYLPEDICIYPEYKGKPYFSIKYKEGNDCIIGYGTYSPKVFSRYLRDYFIPSVTLQEPIHGKCNQCKHYEGVHNVQGHAPCSYHKIGGVMWNWYCSQFESEG